jgi:hypothetical protein
MLVRAAAVAVAWTWRERRARVRARVGEIDEISFFYYLHVGHCLSTPFNIHRDV